MTLSPRKGDVNNRYLRSINASGRRHDESFLGIPRDRGGERTRTVSIEEPSAARTLKQGCSGASPATRVTGKISAHAVWQV